MAALSLVGVCACAGQQETAEEPENTVSGVAHGADLSRCEFKGREDRIATQSQGPGANTPNVFRVYEVAMDSKKGKRTLRCRQTDTNLDGIRDVIRTYTSEGEPLDEQSDTNYDGKIDTWVRFSRGRVLTEHRDRNADGKPDEFRIYSDGRLSRSQRDDDFNGKLDTWQVYDGERLHRVGVDLDGDQRVDRWYRDAELKRQEAAQAAAEDATSVSAPPGAPAPGTADTPNQQSLLPAAASTGGGKEAPEPSTTPRSDGGSTAPVEPKENDAASSKGP